MPTKQLHITSKLIWILNHKLKFIIFIWYKLLFPYLLKNFWLSLNFTLNILKNIRTFYDIWKLISIIIKHLMRKTMFIILGLKFLIHFLVGLSWFASKLYVIFIIYKQRQNNDVYVCLLSNRNNDIITF